jgi:threonylcarbamoyladenosine tRNA methylthiotransferase MtaB
MPPLRVHTPANQTVAFRTVGCRLNQCETAQMQEALLSTGFQLVEWDERADIRVVNTCTVTAKSDRTCRHEIHLAKRLDPDCLLAVTGCFAQVAPESVAAIPGVDLVLGNPDKHRLAEHLAASLQARSAGPIVAVSRHPERSDFESEFFTHFHGYTRAFLKIQTGCDSHCAYCIVPLARGPARSMPRAAVLEQVRLLGTRGYREIVLTGIDLGSWGRDTGEGTLADLLALLVGREVGGGGEAVGALPSRYRLSSIEPLEVDEALIDVVERSGERVARHFHLPLQSGSDSVLRSMGRPYSAGQYLQVANSLARRLPDAAVGADIIVGLPGETEREFSETLSLVEDSPVTYLHVFAYSDRPGTRAADLGPKVSPETIQERSERMRSLGARKKAAFHARLVGSEQKVLVLRERSADGRLVGLTGNYVEVLVGDDETLLNRFAVVRLERSLPDGRWETTMLRREGYG